MPGRPRAAGVAVVASVAMAVYFVLVELHRPALTPNFDVYIYYLPNKIHAVYSAWHAGKGLLWNPYQACGEPFFANPAMGLLYPPHLLFLVLDPNVALHVVLILNMVVGAVGMFLLGIELGFGPVAALGGMVAFQLGSPMATLTGWSPMDNGPWTWLPWALLCCERLLRAPSRRGVAALAVVLALGILPGWVLIGALTYQLIVLRLGWEVITRWPERRWRPIGAVVAGLVLGGTLCAAQVVPAAELARESVRLSATQADFWAYGGLTMDWRAAIRDRSADVPFMVAPLVLAALAPLVGSQRRLVVFYVLVGVLYAVLALGPATPFYELYVRLPPGAATLRYPHRLSMMTGFAITLLAAATLAGIARSGRRAGMLGAPLALALGTALYAFTPGGLRPVEITSLALLVGAVALAAVRAGFVPVGCVLVAAIAVDLVGVPLHYVGRVLPSAQPLWRHADAFAALRARLTPQDRILIVSSMASLMDLGLAQKTATIMRVPDAYDYEPLLGQRLADYYSTMLHGTPVRSVAELTTMAAVVAGQRPRLFGAAAIRYVITPPRSPFTGRGLDLRRIPEGEPGLAVYANDDALPRARYVPRIEVVPDPETLLDRLAFGDDALADVAFVEAPLPSGFTGETSARGTARITRDDPEHVAIDVDAPAPGFLVLADQYAPGWRATVNGRPVPIARTNYAFRLVEVPAGASRAEFLYRPVTVAIGAAISALSAGVIAVLVGRRRA